MKLSGSWKTTLAGIATILTAVGNAVKALVDNDPSTSVDIGVLIAAITAGIGLIMSRDNKVTSEQAGAK